jgi:hypothetical protein
MLHQALDSPLAPPPWRRQTNNIGEEGPSGRPPVDRCPTQIALTATTAVACTTRAQECRQQHAVDPPSTDDFTRQSHHRRGPASATPPSELSANHNCRHQPVPPRLCHSYRSCLTTASIPSLNEEPSPCRPQIRPRHRRIWRLQHLPPLGDGPSRVAAPSPLERRGGGPRCRLPRSRSGGGGLGCSPRGRHERLVRLFF